MHCLVIGATGYVGARLVPRLVEAGHDVRVLARDGRKVAARCFADAVDVQVGDVTDPIATRAACAGVEAVFYLVHSMDGARFAERDRAAATVLATAAREAGVARIVYLGGLQPKGPRTSAHLASRHEVGEVLLTSGVPTAVGQAGIVVGAGSASFEMLRHLAASGPVLPLPDDAWNAVQPIGIDDVLWHLVACLDLPAEVSGAFDVGGRDVLSYREMLAGYAVAAGLRRPLSLLVPVRAPRLAARAVAALTPVDRRLAAPLLESMAHDLVCDGEPPTGTPPGGPASYAEAVRRALAGEGAAGTVPGDPAAPELVTEHIEQVAAPAEALWRVICDAGRSNGGYTLPGWEQLLGVPARRGDPGWRVEAVESGRMLRLWAETALPGVVRLEMRAVPDAVRSRYEQRVTFEPVGLAGRLCWLARLPARAFVLAVMARTIAGVAGTRRPPRCP